jgi:hypothetical protein
MQDEMSILDTNGILTYKKKIANSFNDYVTTIVENSLQLHQDDSKTKQTNSALKRDPPENTGCLKIMVRFQKLTRNLFLTLQGQTVHRQQRQPSKFFMR